LQCLTRTRVERNFRLRTAIGQEPYLGFNALGDIYLAGQAPPAVGPGVTDAAREWSQVDKTSIAELETFVRRHKTSPEADYARARIEGLKQAAATGSRKPTEQPIVSPRPDAGSLGQSIACVNAKFQDDCERAGCTWFLRSCMTPANAIAAKLVMEKTPTAATKCDGVRAQVGNDKRCLKPKDSFRDCHRAGTTTPFWWGSSISPKQANYNGNADPDKGGGSKGEYRGRAAPVDSFEPNPWGLYNVYGNVWEWTEDCWNASNTGNPGDGRARMGGTARSGLFEAVPGTLIRSSSAPPAATGD
jgi:sulfatase-modifying factor enzyme 1